MLDIKSSLNVTSPAIERKLNIIAGILLVHLFVAEQKTIVAIARWIVAAFASW